MADQERDTVVRTPRKRRWIRGAAVAAVLMIPAAATAGCELPCDFNGNSDICSKR
jgi:hypothetical protein